MANAAESQSWAPSTLATAPRKRAAKVVRGAIVNVELLEA